MDMDNIHLDAHSNASVKEDPKMLRQRKKLEAAYKSVFNTVEGQEVLKDLINQSGLLTSPSLNVGLEGRAFLDGSKSIVLHIMHNKGINQKTLQLL